jgi:hypothetical protein
MKKPPTIRPVKIWIRLPGTRQCTDEIIQSLKALQTFNQVVSFNLGYEVGRLRRFQVGKMSKRSAKTARGAEHLVGLAKFDSSGLERIVAALRTLDLKRAHKILSDKG